MLSPERLRRLLEEYDAMRSKERAGALTEDGRQRLELMRDVILEAGVALDAERTGALGRRSARTSVRLEVTFATAADAARAFTKDVGTGGLSVQSAVALPVGTVVEVQLALPEVAAPMRTTAEVVWVRDGHLGLAFRKLPAEEEQQLKRLVSESQPFLERVRASLALQRTKPIAVTNSQLIEDGSEPAAGAPPSASPARPAVGVLIRLTDKELARAVHDLLALHGVRSGEELPPEVRVRAVVADLRAASEAAATSPGVPFIFVEVSGPDALVGRLATLHHAEFVPRPATAKLLLEAVRRALGSRMPNPNR